MHEDTRTCFPDPGDRGERRRPRDVVPSAPSSSFFHAGTGADRIWADPEHDLVVDLRWMAAGHFDGFLGRLLAAVA